MLRYKSIICALLIFPFVHLTMCPAAEKIGNGYLDHVALMKIRTALDKEQSPEHHVSTPCLFSHAADSPGYGRACGTAPRIPFAWPAATQSAISATRLLL